MRWLSQDLIDERQQRKAVEELAQQLEQQLAAAQEESDVQKQDIAQVSTLNSKLANSKTCLAGRMLQHVLKMHVTSCMLLCPCLSERPCHKANDPVHMTLMHASWREQERFDWMLQTMHMHI